MAAGTGLLFQCDPPSFAMEYYEHYEGLAVEMVEGHGFHMERFDWINAPAQTQQQLATLLPFPRQSAAQPHAPIHSARPAPQLHSTPHIPVGTSSTTVGSGIIATPVAEISREISIDSAHAVNTLGRLLALF